MENKYMAQSAMPTCDDHDGEELDTYCRTCEKRTCEICCKTEHIRHDWTTTGKAVKQRRNEGEAIARDIRDNLLPIMKKEEMRKEILKNISIVKDVEKEMITYTQTYVASLVTKLEGGEDEDRTREIGFLTTMADFFEQKVQTGG